MGNAHVSRRAVVRAGDAAMEALTEQRNLFEAQKEILEAATMTTKHTSDRMDGLMREFEANERRVDQLWHNLNKANDNHSSFIKMSFWERLEWLFTGRR